MEVAVQEFRATNGVVPGVSYKTVSRKYRFYPNELREAVRVAMWADAGFDSEGYPLTDSD